MSIIAEFLDHPELMSLITDMRLQVGSVPWVNINRKWMPHPKLKEIITQEKLEKFIRETQSINDEKDLNSEGRELDFAFSAESNTGVVHRFRGHESRNYQGMAIDIRVLRTGTHTLTDLGFRSKLADSLLRLRTGLILIGGSTGSGKSTTLNALINEFSTRQPGSHIITLEDPVEYIVRQPDCLVSQKHVPMHVETFERGIFEAKREKPDLIVIGELRTREAIRGAVEAAGSGHLVMATTFADRVPQVLNVVRDAFYPEEHDSLQNKLGYLVRGVICQMLVPNLKTNPEGFALPSLVYEVLCNDEVWVTSAIAKGGWGKINMQTMDMGGNSVAWEARVTELESGGDIARETAEFLRKK